MMADLRQTQIIQMKTTPESPMQTKANPKLVQSTRSNINPFLAMDVAARAAQMSADGKDIISLALGQPGAPAPKSALDAAAQAIKTGKIEYTSALGISSLRNRIARHYLDKYGIEVNPARIVVTTGSSAGFVLSFLSMFDKGARIAVPSPGYSSYRNIIKALSLQPVEIKTVEESRWTLNADLLARAHYEKKIDGVLFANPNNPNGTMLAKPEFEKLVSTARDLGIRFISDEIYHGLTYEIDETCALEISDDVVIINSFSKYFCMTGWRIGWMIVPESLIRPVDRLQQNMYICAPQISQIAAEAAFEGISEMEMVKQGYVKNRSLVLERLPRLGITDIQPIDGAFYAYGNITPLSNDSMDLAGEILTQTGVALTPGPDFDLERGKSWMRFSFAGEYPRMVEAFDRMDEWITNR